MSRGDLASEERTMHTLSRWIRVSTLATCPDRWRTSALLALLSLLLFAGLLPRAAFAQSMPSGTKTVYVTAGTEAGLGGFYAEPQPPNCTPLPPGIMTTTVSPQFGSLRFEVIYSPLGPGHACSGTQIASTVAYYTWNRSGSGEGNDYFHLHYTDASGGGTPADVDWEPILKTGIQSRFLGNPKLDACGLNCVGDPVNIWSGNMYYSNTDYTTAGQNPLAFTRYYNSRSVLGAPTFATTLGAGWRNNFDRYIRITGSNNVVVERPDGQQLYFTLNGATWTPDKGVDVTLTKSGSTWTLTGHDDTVETYTTNGAGTAAVLNSIKSRNGYTQTLAYNGSGQLSTVTDSYSRTLTLSYSGATLSTVSTPDSTTITYGYTTAGGSTVLNTASFPGTTGMLTYNYGASPSPATTLTSVVDESGNTYASWTYDQYSRATQSQLGSGADLTTIAYYDDGTQKRTVTNAFGLVETHQYGVPSWLASPVLTSVSRAATTTTPFMSKVVDYDANGYVQGTSDWNGNVTVFTNNAHGDPTQIVEAVSTPLARTTTIAYHSTFVHLPQTITTPGVTTTFTYDANGNPLTKTLTDTTTTSIPYSTNGQTRTWTYTWNNFLLASVKSPRTDVAATTSFGYGTDGALTSITDALAHVTNITSHTVGGRPLTVVDPNGVTTTFTYDARQRLTSNAVGTSGGTLTTTLTVDPTGLISKITPPAGRWRVFNYDMAHRLTKITDRYNQYIQYTLDALGDTTQAQSFTSTPTLVKSHTATFDPLGRKLTDVGGQGQTTTFNYDKMGHPLTVYDGLNQSTQRSYDQLNRVKTRTDANLGVITPTYDAHDRVLSVQDQNGHTTSYVYNGFGDVIQETSPDRGTTVYHYDNNGNMTSKTDALGVITNQAFDKLDRVTYTTYPANPTMTSYYHYDETGTGFSFGIGRLTSVVDSVGTLTRKFDERGNLLSEKRVNGPNTYTTSYGYDSESKIISMTYPNGTVVNYSYDYPGTVYQVSATPAGGTATTIATNVNHLPFGPLNHLSYGNGIWEHWYKDLDYRTTSVNARASNGTGATVTRLDYSYDAANNVKTITDYINAANSQTLTYDVLNRIKTAVSGTGGYGNYTYTFDPVGNLTSLLIGSTNTNYTYASGTNRLSAVGAISVSTDADGNITGAPIVGGTSAATFTYTVGQNRLNTASGGGISLPISSLWYDGFGKRFVKWTTSGPTQYFYDQAGNVIEEQTGGQKWNYVYVDGVLIAVINPTASPSANQINYITHDRLGTPQMAFNTSATQVWSNTYKPFGEGGIPISSIVNDLRLPGQLYDRETGFHYNMFRDYMPNIGRYLEADPIGLLGGVSPYLYAKANPMTFVDKSGLASQNPYDDIADRVAGIGGQCPYGPCDPNKETSIREDTIKLMGRIEVGATGVTVGGFLAGQPEVAGPAFVIGVCAGGLKNFLEKDGNPGTEAAIDYYVKMATQSQEEAGVAADVIKLLFKLGQALVR
jgi:RHS repeat-associated protein